MVFNKFILIKTKTFSLLHKTPFVFFFYTCTLPIYKRLYLSIKNILPHSKNNFYLFLQACNNRYIPTKLLFTLIKADLNRFIIRYLFRLNISGQQKNINAFNCKKKLLFLFFSQIIYRYLKKRIITPS